MEVDRQLCRSSPAPPSGRSDRPSQSTPAEQLLAAITASPHEEGKGWLHSFDDIWPSRQPHEGIADVVLPSWREDATSPLGTIKTFLQQPGDHDFGAAAASPSPSATAIETARSKLSAAQRARRGPRRVRGRQLRLVERGATTTSTCAPTSRCAVPLALATVSGASEATDGLFLFRPGVRRGHQRRAVVAPRSKE